MRRITDSAALGMTNSYQKARRKSELPNQQPDGMPNLGLGIALAVGGLVVLFGLFTLNRTVKLDTILVASQAVYNIISGLRGIGGGIAQLAIGLLQMIGFSALACVALISVLSICSGSLRIAIRATPQMRNIWGLLAAAINSLIRLAIIPQRTNGTIRNSSDYQDHLATASSERNPRSQRSRRVA